MAYFKLGSLFKGISTTATAAGTTTLTNSSKQYQQFTGTTTQTVVLPDATTLQNGRRFDIFNRSTGVVTVNFNGGALAATVPANSQRYFYLTSNSTSAGSWVVGAASSSATVSASDKLNLLSGMAGIQASTDNIESRLLKFNPEEVGGNFWRSIKSTATSKSYATACTLNGYAYSTGGYNGVSALTANERYSDDNNYWLSRAVLPAGRSSHAAKEADGFFYVIGGQDTAGAAQSNNYQYNDSTDAFTTKTSLTSARGVPGCFSFDNQIYLFQGLALVYTDNTSELFDNTSNAWRSRGNLPYQARSSRGAVLNGYGYAVSGAQFAGPVSNTARFDSSSNSWSSSAPIQQGTNNAACFAINGTMYSAGGEKNPGPAYSTVVERYSDVSNVWLYAVSMPQRTGGGGRQPTGTALNGSAITTNGGDSGSPTTDADYYVGATMLNLGSLKRSTAVPTSILVSTLTNDLANNLPVQIRTDGDSWKKFLSGSDSVLKLGETLSTKFVPYPLGYCSGGGVSGASSTDNEQYNDVQNIWATRTPVTVPRRGPYFLKASGIGYLAGGSDSSSVRQTQTYSFSDITNTWTTKSGTLPAARDEGASFDLVGFGYAATGVDSGGNVTNVNYQYNPTSDSWATKTVVPISRRSPAAFAIGDFGYVAGGVAAGSVYTGTAGYKYSPASDAWVSIGNLATGVGDNSGGAEINGAGYSFGGFNGSSDQSTVQKYNPQTDSWASAGNMVNIREKSGGTFRLSGAVIIASGHAGGTNFNTVSEKYNPDSQTSSSITAISVGKINAASIGAGAYYNYEVRVGIPAFYAGIGSYVWTTRANMNSAKSGHAGGILGGVSLSFDLATSTNNEYFVPEANAWLKTTATPNSHNTGCYFDLLDFLYLLTGPASSPTSNADRYNHISKSWSAVTGVNSPATRYYGGGRTLNGFGYKMGGQNSGGTQLTTVEKYDPSLNSWSNVASISGTNTSGMGNGGTFGGFMYRFGGFDNNSNTMTNTVQEFNDAGNTWLTKTSYPTNIYAAFSKEVAKGVLVGGGSTSVGAYVSTTYEFNPTMNAYLQKINFPTTIQGAPFDGAIVAGGENGSAFSTSYQYIDSIKQAVLGLALEVK